MLRQSAGKLWFPSLSLWQQRGEKGAFEVLLNVVAHFAFD